MPDPACPFCRRISEWAYHIEWPGIARFEPLSPVTPGHMLFVPLTHASDAAADPEGAGLALAAAAHWARDRGQPCNLITSVGPEATQTVFHTHVHYVPRAAGDGLALPWRAPMRDQRYLIAG